MTKRQQNVMFRATIAVVGFIILSFLFGCKTTKKVTETVYTHDTLTVHHTDTVQEMKVKEVRDTVKQIERHTYTLNNMGDTIKEVHHYHDIMRTLIVDSTERYKAKMDSLQRLVDVEKEKTVKKMEKKPRLTGLTMLLLLFVGCIVYLLLKKGTRI